MEVGLMKEFIINQKLGSRIALTLLKINVSWIDDRIHYKLEPKQSDENNVA